LVSDSFCQNPKQVVNTSTRYMT